MHPTKPELLCPRFNLDPKLPTKFLKHKGSMTKVSQSRKIQWSWSEWKTIYINITITIFYTCTLQNTDDHRNTLLNSHPKSWKGLRQVRSTEIYLGFISFMVKPALLGEKSRLREDYANIGKREHNDSQGLPIKEKPGVWHTGAGKEHKSFQYRQVCLCRNNISLPM